jgi:hypothetical protein
MLVQVVIGEVVTANVSLKDGAKEIAEFATEGALVGTIVYDVLDV